MMVPQIMGAQRPNLEEKVAEKARILAVAGDQAVSEVFSEIEMPHVLDRRPTFIKLAQPCRPQDADELLSLFNIQVSSVTSAAGVGGVHSHPKLAALRALGERLAHKYISTLPDIRFIHDIASNVRRTDDLRVLPKDTVIHVSTPLVLLPNDAARAKGATEKGRANHCFHRLEDETCGTKVRFDCAISTHVLYYIDPEVLAKYLATQVRCGSFVLSVHHVFEGNSGRFTLGKHEEARWWRDKGLIRMDVEPYKTQKPGRGSDYVHPDQPYLRRRFTALRGGGFLMTETLDVIGDIIVAKISLQRGQCPADGESLTVRGTQLTYLFPRYSVNREYDVVLPDAAVASVAKRLVGKRRDDPSTHRDATFHARRVVDDLGIPDVQQPAAIAFVADAASTLTLQLEADLNDQRERKFGRLIAYHSSQLAGERPPFYRVVVDALVGVVSYPDFGRIWEAFPSVSIKSAPISQLSIEDQEWVDSANQGEPNSLLGAPVVGPIEVRHTGEVNERYPKMDPGTKIVLRENFREKDDSSKTAMFLEGYASTELPSVHRNHDKTLVAALRHRCALETPPVDVAFLAEMTDIFKKTEVWKALRARPYVQPEDSVIISRWMKLQPRSMHRAYLEAFDSIKAMPVGTEKRDYLRKLFVKLEKSQADSTMLGTPESKPRVIAAMNENNRMKVATCPWLSHFMEWLFETLREEGSPVIITPGMCCEDISAEYETEGMMGTVEMNSDQIKFDAHMRHIHFVWVFNIFMELGLDPDVVRIELEAGNNGVSGSGAVFISSDEEETDRLYSGDGATTLIGSVVNGFLLASFFALMNLRKYVALVSGDDSLSKICIRGVDQHLDECYNGHCLRLGFEAETTLKWNPWESKYCSKMFWPITPMRDSDPSIMLGPLPGRLLGKIAWTLKHPKEGNFRGTLIAANRDAHHVPFVRVYVSFFLRMTEGARAKFSSHYNYGAQTSRKHFANEEIVWVWMMARYGFGREDEDAFADWLEDNIKQIPCVKSNRWMARLIEVDSGKSSSNDVGGLY